MIADFGNIQKKIKRQHLQVRNSVHAVDDSITCYTEDTIDNAQISDLTVGGSPPNPLSTSLTRHRTTSPITLTLHSRLVP